MFRNLQIRSKLVAIVLIPILALMVFAAAHAMSSVRTRVEAERLNRATQFATTMTALVDALQRERAISSGFIASARRTSYGTMITGRLVANSASRSFDESVRSLDTAGFSAQFRTDLSTARASLAQLSGFRAQIESQSISPAQVAAGYGTEIETLLDVIGDISEQEGGRSLGRGVDALVAVSRAKEAASQSQGTLFAALSEGSFGTDDYQRFVTAGGEEQAYLAQFRLAADPGQRAYFDQTVTGFEVTRADIMGQAALTARDLPQGVEPMDWFAATSAKIDRLHQVELRVGADLAAASEKASLTAARSATIDIVGTALLVGLALGSSLLLARSMAVPLRRLERRVREVAETDLPGVVYRLQHGGGSELAVIDEHSTGEVPVRSSDEIGRLAAAFNSVHRVAVRVAIEQAALRKSIGDMFVNLARRSQSLIDRQLNLIDELERRTEDPEHLADLFRLDHLATRMRRNAENLLVLSNTEPGRRWSEPMTIADVLRAASSEVEDFSRVELSTGDRLRLAGHAGSDVVHLLAELIENAITFSPPDTRVRLRAQRGAKGYLIEIEDSGIGMSDSELAAANDRLANPPEIDLALERMLGFFVVGRLAARHGIEVRLRHSWYGGVIVLVVIPGALMLTEQPAWSGAASSVHAPLPAPAAWTARQVAVAQPALEPTRGATTTGLMAEFARGDLEFARGDVEVTRRDDGATPGDVEFTRGDVGVSPGDIEVTRGDVEVEVTWGVAGSDSDSSAGAGTSVDTGWLDAPDSQPRPPDGTADRTAEGGAEGPADGGVAPGGEAGDATPSVFDPPPTADPLPPPPPLPDPPPAAPRGAPPASDRDDPGGPQGASAGPGAGEGDRDGPGGPQDTTANAGDGAGDLFADLRTGMLHGRVAGGHRPGRAGLGPPPRPPGGRRKHSGPAAS